MMIVRPTLSPARPTAIGWIALLVAPVMLVEAANASQATRGNADTGASRVSEMSDEPTRATAQDAQVDQITARPTTADGPLPSEPPEQVAQEDDARRAAAPAQLTRDGERPAASQLGDRERETSARQMYTGGRTAQPATPLSSTSQSAPQSVVRLQGRDRCDAPGNEAGICARVIETRSGEFARGSPLTLSPEQRLLVDQRIREAPMGVETAAKRLGRGFDETSLESQGVASMVLSADAAARADRPEDPASPLGGFDQPTIDIIRGIAEGLGAQVLQPPR